MNENIFKLSPKWILLCLSILFFLILIIFFLLNNPKNEPSKEKINITLTPTPFQRQLGITSISPVDKSNDIGLLPEITVSFSESLTLREQSSVKFLASPAIDGLIAWSSDKKTVSLLPNKPLKASQKYLVSISYPTTTYTWNFTTVSSENVSLEDQAKIQTMADKDFAEKWAAINKNYPWFNSLPLQKQNYFVYFDLDKKIFVAKLYPKKSSSESIEAQVSNLKNEITPMLNKLGVDEEKYKIEWKVIPE